MTAQTIEIRVILPETEGRYLKLNPKGPRGLQFWNSLFCWLALLAAFKFWLSTYKVGERIDRPKPKKILINSRMYPLESISVSGNTLLVENQVVRQGDVHLAGFLFEINGELVLDLSKQGYSTIETLPDKIIINK